MTKKEIIYLDDIPSRAILVWEYLGLRENKDHQCWPSINRMARELHLSRSTVKRALHDLTEGGWITASRGSGPTAPTPRGCIRCTTDNLLSCRFW